MGASSRREPDRPSCRFLHCTSKCSRSGNPSVTDVAKEPTKAICIADRKKKDKSKKDRKKNKAKRALKRSGGEQRGRSQAAMGSVGGQPGFESVYRRGLDAVAVDQRDQEVGTDSPCVPSTSYTVPLQQSMPGFNQDECVPPFLRQLLQNTAPAGPSRNGET